MDLTDLECSQGAFSEQLGALTPEDWPRPTPCPGWDVAAVVRHVVVGERAFTTSLGGSRYDLPVLIEEIAAIPLAELPASYDAGAARLRHALQAADPTMAYPTGIGPMAAEQVSQLRTIEVLVHGWDVARGADRVLSVADGAAERAIQHARDLLERLPADRQPFGPAVGIADGAPAIDRLVAMLGRSPT